MAGNGISRCLQWRAKHDHVFSAFHPLKPLLRPSTLRKENRVIKLFVMSLSGKTPFLAFVHCSCCASPGELFHYLTAQQRPPYLCKNPGSLNPWNNRIGVFKFRMQKERQAPMLHKDFSYTETFLLFIQFFLVHWDFSSLAISLDKIASNSSFGHWSWALEGKNSIFTHKAVFLLYKPTSSKNKESS